MDFNFTEEQAMLREQISRFLADRYDFEQRRRAVASPEGWRPDIWQAFAGELGLLGAAFPESLGGYGGGPVETMIVMEEFGKALVVEPYLGTVVIGGGFLKHSGWPQAKDLVAKIISGEARIAFAHAEPQGCFDTRFVATTARRRGETYVLDGHKAVVIGAPWATHLIVTARTASAPGEAEGLSVFLVEKNAPGITTTDYPTVDGLRASEIRFDAVEVPTGCLLGEEGRALPLIEQVIDEATAAACAEAVGCMQKLHEGTLDYARERRQFGTPIGKFQALQHRMVDMFIALEQSVSMSYMATMMLGAPATERARAVSAAKAFISRSAKFVGQSAIQIHGGMGMTDELAIGHYFKRATMIEGLFGTADHHLRRYEALQAA
ncbi:acyl-CoA dehydrogenase family protein [Pedomonas mirosovicensis]|uniref:acyl-CoA dehydrogenase family protein n=1 Tax=Pedomonas mirosovicensis TaxID=2908641 RepID=UPI0021676776|nr:acyl-CoA dehydrogenase family protein [Pedomonas mirosovicensis]MCH8684525.1 acyl-CoA dehydrogenase family protein [Pedomonas mirosovicensis]